MKRLKKGKIRKWQLLLCGMLLFLFGLKAQTITSTNLTGTVTTESGELLNGVTVDVKATDNKTSLNTVTNEKGIFTIATLVAGKSYNFSFSYVGYEVGYVKSFKIKEGNGNSILVRLKQSSANLDQVVVVGYGTQQKRFLTGAASQVKSAELKSYVSSSFAAQLAGKAAGVVVNTTSAQPGADPQIVIRGIGTLTAGRNPLIVVDGFPLSEGSSLNSVNPYDIETIDILKDPASAAIYGSRAANGVILITTKKGKSDALKVSVDFFTGYQERADKVQFVNAEEAALYFTEARDWGYVSKNPANRSVVDDRATRIAKGASLRELRLNYLQPYLDKQPGLTNTSWLEEIYRRAPMTGYNLAFSGGSAKTNYYVSANYFDQKGLIIENDYKRFSGTIKVDSKISDKIDFGVSLNPSYGIQNYFDNNAGLNNDPIAAASIMYPFFSPYNADGSLAISQQIIANGPEDGALGENPVAMRKKIKNVRNTYRMFGNTFLSYQIAKGLKFKTMIGGDFSNAYIDFFNPSDIGAYRTAVPNKPAAAQETNGITTNYLTENTITYSNKFGKHDFNVLAGFTFQKEFGSNTIATGTGIPDNNTTNIAGASAFTATTSKYIWTQISYLSRFQYAYAGKYLLSLTARRDGSSRFGNDAKWGNFPSVTTGWVISNESFFPKSNVVTFAKIRGTWGKAGNNQIGAYGSRSLASGGAAFNYVYGNTLSSGFAAITTPNSNLSWETKVSANIGLDIGLLNKINVGLDYYKTNTEDLLLNVPVPEQSGFSTSTQNIGKVENKGIEMEIAGTSIKLGKIIWGFSANIASNQNKVLALAPGQTQIIAGSASSFYTKVGGSVAELYGYQVTGVFKDQATLDKSPKLSGTLLGDYIVEDINKDGIIDTKDFKSFGTYNPKFTYGFSSNFSYNQFDFSFDFMGVAGRKIYDHGLSTLDEAGEGFSMPSKYYFDNRYHPLNNPNGFLGQPNYGNFSAARRAVRASSLFYKNADYLRLRTVQLGYNLPGSLFQRLKLSAARFYITGNNLFTLTQFKGYNPDATSDNVLSNGQSNSNYPVARTWTIGINLNF